MENNRKQFKPYDKVLVIRFKGKWKCAFYSHWDEKLLKHVTTTSVGYYDDEIIPYEGNEHLVGTTNEPEEEIKLEEGEWLMVSNGIHSYPSKWGLRECIAAFPSSIMVKNSDIICTPALYKYAIRFSDFNPENMEETRKHILFVKNGKIIRYKE